MQKKKKKKKKKKKRNKLKILSEKFLRKKKEKKKKKKKKAANHLLRLYSRESFFEQMMQEILFDLCVKEMNWSWYESGQLQLPKQLYKVKFEKGRIWLSTVIKPEPVEFHS